MKIVHEGKSYELDIKAAIERGAAKRIENYENFKVGDVWNKPDYSPILIVRVHFNNESYQLLGLGGLSPYSNPECRRTLTKEEVINYLRNTRLSFVKNINKEVRDLIQS